MSKYVYEGPVMMFGKMISDRWKGETIAPSQHKARNNLAYQFKKQTGLLPSGSIHLPGKLSVLN